MLNTFHLRFTPQQNLTISGERGDFIDLIAKTDKIVIAEEGNATVQRHFHIHISTKASDDTIRRLVQTSFKIPKMKRGQTNKIYSLKEWDTDISYVVKGGNILVYKGYTEEYIAEAIAAGQDRYKGKIDEREFHKSHHTSLWEELKVATADLKLTEYKEYAKFINFYTLRKGGALQHPANVKRYALSLMIINKAKGDDKTLRQLADKVDIPDEYE